MIANALQPGKTGRLALRGVRAIAGLGDLGEVYREGGSGCYVSESLETDETKRPGPLILAEAERKCSAP